MENKYPSSTWKFAVLLSMTIALFVPLHSAAVGTSEPIGKVAASGCVADLQTLCLNNYEFEVVVEWEDSAMILKEAKAVFITSDTGYFWFEDPRYPDVVIKVLDGCAINGRYWVFWGGLSSRAYDLTIKEVSTGAMKLYSNPLGTLPTPVTDTDAISCSPPGASSPEASSLSSIGSDDLLPQGPVQPVSPLVDGRFEVRVSWRDFNGGMGNGVPVDLTGHASYFYFFSSSNAELFIKIVDNAESTGFFSVVASGLTNVAYDIEVTDTCNGQVKVYANPLGNLGSFADLTAFSATGSCIVLSDTFESGDLQAWSEVR